MVKDEAFGPSDYSRLVVVALDSVSMLAAAQRSHRRRAALPTLFANSCRPPVTPN
jgi:hypothetical protein